MKSRFARILSEDRRPAPQRAYVDVNVTPLIETEVPDLKNGATKPTKKTEKKISFLRFLRSLRCSVFEIR